MTTATATTTYTRAHTAVHLNNAICGAIIEILTQLGLEASSLASTWSTRYEPAIRSWIEEGSLSCVTVECTQPSKAIWPILEFPVEYTDGAGSFQQRHAALARLWAKQPPVAKGTSFRIICHYRWTPSVQAGWSSTTAASTEGLRTSSLGTLASGPHATASIRIHTQ